MTTFNFAPVLQQLAAREGIDVTDLYIEGNVVFKRKDGWMTGTVCQIGTPYWKRRAGCGRGAGAAARTVNRGSRRRADKKTLTGLCCHCHVR